MEKVMDVKAPFKGARYVLIVPRVDLGNALIGRPCSYIGVDDITAITSTEGAIQAILGKRFQRSAEGAILYNEGNPLFDIVCQIPGHLDYQVLDRNDVEFTNPVNFVKKQILFKKEIEKLYKEDGGNDPDGPVVTTVDETDTQGYL